MTSLRKAMENYLTMRRSLGFKLRDMGYNLHHFVSFMEQQGASIITAELALRWAQQPQNVQPAHWAARLSFVRSFARYWSAIDPRTEIPPMGLLPFRSKRATPYIYSDEEIDQVLKAAKNLPPSTGLRPWTYYTLFGLMATTGMRVSEVIHLDRGDDVDLDHKTLTVRLTKFSKSRLIPLHPSAVKNLTMYLNRRDQLYPRSAAARFFLSNQGMPLTDCMVRWTFVKLSRQIGLRKLGESFGPRLHDFRHRFAVTTLLHWYQTGVDVEQCLPVLSTYLGHAHVTDTYWYLSAIPELLALTKDRLEKRWEALS
jgi:integrase/recombinase XerD